MKKIISFALAIMMIATMSVTAFAATIDSENPNASIPVTLVLLLARAMVYAH